jgi:hypothetical protein
MGTQCPRPRVLSADAATDAAAADTGISDAANASTDAGADDAAGE